MKKMIAIALALTLTGSTFAPVYADNAPAGSGNEGNERTTIEEAGVMPDSPFYGLERKLEELQIAITKSRESLAELEAKLGIERAAEAVVMYREGKEELSREAANEYAKLLASSARNINKAIELQDDALESIDSLNEAYGKSEIILNQILLIAPDESKNRIQDVIDGQDDVVSAVNAFYAAKNAFFDAKDQLAQAKQELKIARIGGGPEAIAIAEEKVIEAEALKDQLEELKDAAEASKEEVKAFAQQAENSLEKGLGQVEQAEDKMTKAEDKAELKATREAEKQEQKLEKEEEKALKKQQKEELREIRKEAKEAAKSARKDADSE